MRELLKRVGRPLLGVPVLGRLLRILRATWRGPVNAARLDQIDGRIAQLSGALDSVLHNITEVVSRQREMDADRDNLVRSVPVALRRLSRAEVSLVKRLDEMEGRIAVLVGQLGQAPASRDTEVNFEPVKAQVKIDLGARTEPLRVNLGCGQVKLAGYVNVDNRDLPSVDVVADVYTLPFGDGTVAEFFSSHFLEHFPLEELRRRLLPVLRSKLAPGGKLRAIVPDVDAMMRAYVAGDLAYEDMREVVYGGQDHDGDFHHNMFTPKSLTELLTIGGFDAVKIVETGRVNGKALEFEIEATRV
jgi:predicted SAM-dependent methyltransferase